MSAKRSTTKHPYAAIEHRVIDSAAYADLGHSSVRLLLLIARQLTRPNNNGHLQASFEYCKKHGFGSEHTLRGAIADLIAHGFIYRTRSHGANRIWARYAVTWLPVSNRDGLFLDGFAACSWRDWTPDKKKKLTAETARTSSRKCSFTPDIPAETAGNRGAETAAYELVPCTGTFAGGEEPAVRARQRTPWASPLLIRGSSHLDRGNMNSSLARGGLGTV
jgi:hypothetical protein